MGVFSLAGWSRQIHAGFLVSRATQDTARVPTGFAYGGVTLCAPPFQGVRLPVILPISRSYYPAAAWTAAVWAPPRSLATTCGITFVLFSWGYLDVSVPPVRPAPFGAVAPLQGLGCPIRTPADHSPFAAPRSFSQLITSFFASMSLGIHHSPFPRFLFSHSMYLTVLELGFCFVRLAIMSKIFSPASAGLWRLRDLNP